MAAICLQPRVHAAASAFAVKAVGRPALRPALALKRYTHRATTAAAARPQRCTAAAAGAVGSSSSDSPPVPRPASERRLIAAVNRQLAARVAEQCGLGPEEAAHLARSIAQKGPDHQAALMQHGRDVAALLVNHGIEPPALAALLKQRNAVFMQPVADVAARLQAMLAIGLTPAEAAHALGQNLTVPEWDDLPLAHPDLPARVAWLKQLAVRCNSTFSPQRILASSVRMPAPSMRLIEQPTRLLESCEAALQQELGGDCRLFCRWLCTGPDFRRDGGEVLRRRAQLLVQAVGQEAALCLANERPQILSVYWPDDVLRALEVMRLCGVADPAATFSRYSRFTGLDAASGTALWVNAPYALVNRLALQRAFGLTPAQVYEKHGSLLRSWYTSWHEVPTETLAYRLLLVEQAGLRPLSVQASRPRDYGQPGWVESRVSERGKRAYIAVDGSGMDPDAFRAKLALVGSAADSAGDAGARALRQLQLLQAEARQEVARLNALLPPELQL